VEHHQEALLPWAIERRHLRNSLFLVTLDHHTDTQYPFLRRLVGTTNIEAASEERLFACNIQADSSVKDCIEDLACDEQIQTATKLGIFDAAFVISWDGNTDIPLAKEMSQYLQENHKYLLHDFPTANWTATQPSLPLRPFSYARTENSIYVLGNEVNAGYSHAISDVHLISRLRILNNMASSIGMFSDVFEKQFILDIDLDYFHTRNSLNPASSKEFYKLIKSAQAITIATEPEFVAALAEDIDSESILDLIKEHIVKAINDC
jgi:hypothetical protein